MELHTTYLLKVRQIKVTLQAENGAEIESYLDLQYVVNGKNEQSLLGKADAIQLGII